MTDAGAIEVSTQEGATVVRLPWERLDLERAPEFRTRLAQLIRAGDRYFVIDLERVTFIDSSGLGALVSALKMLKTTKERRKVARADVPRRPSARGDVRLAMVQPQVASLLEIIRLHRVFRSFPSIEEAARSYEPQAP